MRKRHRSLRERWRRSRLGAVERYYFDCKENTTHPFQDLGDGFYYIAVRSDKFVFGLGLIATTVLSFTLFCVFVDFFSFPLALFFVTIAYGVFSMYGNLSTKELIISRNGGYLMRIKGSNKILVEEPVHNCYIKLQRKYDANRLPHFYLILGGYRLDDIRITGMANHDGALRLLGSRLAARMGINYFDYDNNSTLHQIIHYPSFTLLRIADEEYAKFLADHHITDDEVDRAKLYENFTESSNVAPEAISKKIKQNYLRGAALYAEDLQTKRRTAIPEKDVFSLKRTVQLVKHLQKLSGKDNLTNVSEN